MEPVTFRDLSLKHHGLTPRVEELRQAYFQAWPEICIERADLVTQYSLAKGFFGRDRISALDKARMYRWVLENRHPVVRHTHCCQMDSDGLKVVPLQERQLFAGSTTRKFKGVPIYPEFFGLTIWPELNSISTREKNPYYLTAKQIEALNHHIFPPWMQHTILEVAREKAYLQGLTTLGARETPAAPKEIELLEKLVFFLASKGECISHTIPDFSRALNEGLHGIIAEAKDREENTSDREAQEFYRALSIILEGIIAYSHRLAKEAKRLADREKNKATEMELREIADIHLRIPENPAQNFREALTTIWVCWTAIHLENPNIGISLGRLDQVLYPFYRKDLDGKVLDVDGAIELLCLFWLKLGDHVPMVPQAAEQLFGGGGSNQAITIGGVDRDGRDAVNDLTYVILRAIELMMLRDPNLNARYYPGVNSAEYLERLIAANLNTGATPAIHNDPAVVAGLMEGGDSKEDALDYGIVGCVEPVSCGRTYSACSSILLNLASVLELALFNGRHRHTHKYIGLDGEPIGPETGDPATFRTFKEFKEAFETQARWMVDQTTELNNLLGKVHQDLNPTPILSAFFEGPMEKGKDLIQGGAKINASGVTIIGLADVADSLSAIERVVYGPSKIPFGKLLTALKDNFRHDEPLRRRLLDPDRTPKYGNEDPQAEKHVRAILELLGGAFGEKENYRGGGYRVGYWTMTIHAGYARLIGAIPNGRKEGENLASGITPVSGVTPWLLKNCNSVADLPSEFISNGMAFNLRVIPEGPSTLQRLVPSVASFFSQGGMEIQFNIISQRDFERAVIHPEEYPELLVRVSGYTAYFKDLNPQMQQEIMGRTEFLPFRPAGHLIHFQIP